MGLDVTRLGRLTLFFCAVATAICLATIPMTWDALNVLATWLLALLGALALAVGVDNYSWHKRRLR